MLHSLIISLPMFTCLFWLVGYSLPRTNRYNAQRILLIFYSVTTLLYGCHWLYFYGVRSPYSETVYSVSNLAVYPLFLYYLLRLSGQAIGRYWWLLLPAGVIALAYPVCFLGGWLDMQHYFYIFARTCFAAEVLIVWLLGSRCLRELKNMLDNYFTDDRSAGLHTLRVLLWLFGLIALFSVLWNAIGREAFAGSMWLALPSVLMSVLLYALGYAAFLLEDPLQGLMEETTLATIEKGKEPQNTNGIVSHLEEIMLREKLYLHTDLTISDMALALGTNRTYLSTAINQQLGVNFSTYINRLRIDEAKRILNDGKYTSDKEAIMDAMLLSGFTSEQTFYRVFKELTGTTPLRFRQQHS